MKNKNAILSIILFAVLPFIFMGCAGLFDNSSSGNSYSLSLRALQSQLGMINPETGALQSPTESPANTPVQSLIVGTVAVHRLTAYTEADISSEEVVAQIRDEFTNSSEFMKMIPLPTDTDEIEVNIPPPGSEHWQFFAAAITTTPANLGDMANAPHSQAIAYYGFSPTLYITNQDGAILEEATSQSPDLITVTLQRACMVLVYNPATLGLETPKGCAQYPPFWGLMPVVSSAVEILSVTSNMGALAPQTGFSYPLVVRGNPATGEIGAYGASYSALPKMEIMQAAGVTSATVELTRQLSSAETTACAAAARTDADLRANCRVYSYTTEFSAQ